MKNFSENYLRFGYVPSKRFTSRVLGQKTLKNIGLKGCHTINLTRGVHMSRAGPGCNIQEVSSEHTLHFGRCMRMGLINNAALYRKIVTSQILLSDV